MTKVTKRLFDIGTALAIMPLAIMICLPFAFAFSITTGEKPLYRQTRTGLSGRPFKIWKLRTMTEARDTNGELLPDADRLTLIGRFLRRFSIDEVPQLVNILLGEMSFVGPRPQIDQFLQAMTEYEKRRHDVLPGVTGWAQINGRNAVTWHERFCLDVWYVDNASFWLDMKIIFRTPEAILSAAGISHEGHETMPTLFEERKHVQRADA